MCIATACSSMEIDQLRVTKMADTKASDNGEWQKSQDCSTCRRPCGNATNVHKYLVGWSNDGDWLQTQQITLNDPVQAVSWNKWSPEVYSKPNYSVTLQNYLPWSSKCNYSPGILQFNAECISLVIANSNIREDYRLISLDRLVKKNTCTWNIWVLF